MYISNWVPFCIPIEFPHMFHYVPMGLSVFSYWVSLSFPLSSISFSIEIPHSLSIGTLYFRNWHSVCFPLMYFWTIFECPLCFCIFHDKYERKCVVCEQHVGVRLSWKSWKHCIFHWFYRQPRWVRQKHVFDKKFKKREQLVKKWCRSNMAFSQLFYRHNCLYLDRKDAAWRGPRSFEHTFSIVSWPLDALGLRLCSKTPRGARSNCWLFLIFCGFRACGGGLERRGNSTFLLVLELVTVLLYLNL